MYRERERYVHVYDGQLADVRAGMGPGELQEQGEVRGVRPAAAGADCRGSHAGRLPQAPAGEGVGEVLGARGVLRDRRVQEGELREQGLVRLR